MYEKGDTSNTNIYWARYIGQIREQKPYWKISQVSDCIYNINPSFGTLGGISYQTKENNIWRIVYQAFHDYDGENFIKTTNISCNYEHPMLFRFLIPTSPTSSSLLGFFLTFDSDSLANDKEIFILPEPLNTKSDTIINISNIPGDDSKPIVAYLNSMDNSSQISITWEHQENNKIDIWWATSLFQLISPGVNDKSNIKPNFKLYKNFPNPFNLETVIKYELLKPSYVTLKIYNLKGQLIQTLIEKRQKEDSYTVKWQANDLPSGIYLYRISVENFVKTEKCVFVK